VGLPSCALPPTAHRSQPQLRAALASSFTPRDQRPPHRAAGIPAA
jgi:hypothetical protein